MYSKSKGMHSDEYSLTPPPGYDGSRFRHRSDGRDDAFPMYPDPPQRYFRQRKQKAEYSAPPVYDEPSSDDTEPESCDLRDEATLPCPIPEKEKKSSDGLLSFIEGLRSEELLLIALTVLLCTTEGRQSLDTILILALLLCV